jgi:hypothetical protein
MAPNQYCVLPADAYHLAGGRVVLRCKSPARQRTLVFDRHQFSLLNRCAGAKTLEEHAAGCMSDDPSNQELDAAADVLERLVLSGHVRPYESSQGPDSVAPHEMLNCVAIVTAGRPAMARRSLDSIMSHCRAHDRYPQVMIIDGSPNPDDRAQIQDAVGILGPASGAVYIGPSEAAAFHSHLQAEGVSPDLITAGLQPGATGANRNLALLLAAGQNVLMLDDDVIVRPFRSPRFQQGLALGGHHDLYEWQFFSSRKEALDAALPTDVDILQAHSELLGDGVQKQHQWRR